MSLIFVYERVNYRNKIAWLLEKNMHSFGSVYLEVPFDVQSLATYIEHKLFTKNRDFYMYKQAVKQTTHDILVATLHQQPYLLRQDIVNTEEYPTSQMNSSMVDVSSAQNTFQGRNTMPDEALNQSSGSNSYYTSTPDVDRRDLGNDSDSEDASGMYSEKKCEKPPSDDGRVVLVWTTTEPIRK